MPLRQKVQATLHLSGYCVHLLLAALVILYPLVLEISRHYPSLVTLFGIGLFFNLTAFAPTIFFVVAEKQLGRRVWWNLPVILFLSAMGTGMMVNTLRAAAGIAFHRKGTFERTPKFGIVQRKQNWMNRNYQLKLDPIVFPELAFALANAATAALAIHQQNWMIAVYACLFCSGLFFTSGMTLMQSLSVARKQAPSFQQPKEGLP
jgi:hypothetical protein